MSYDDIARLHDYKIAFGSPEGRRVLLDILSRSWAWSSPWHNDPQVLAFRAGEHSGALEILRYLELTPEDVLRLRAEETRPSYSAQLFGGEDGG